MHCKNPYALQRLKGSTLKTIPTQKYEFFVPCGKCLYCRLQRRKEWCLRLQHENSYHTKSSFVTLTYTDENLPMVQGTERSTLKKSDLQNFFKKLRKKGYKFKYYACGEYGEKTERAHYHAIIFGIDYEETKPINDAWDHGSTHIGSVTADSIRYVAQYIDKKIYGKKSEHHYRQRTPEWQCNSQGLGRRFLIDNICDITSNGYVKYKDLECTIPRYYLKQMKKILSTQEWETFCRKREKKAKFKNLDIHLEILEKETGEYHELSLENKEKVRLKLIKAGLQVEQTLKDKAKIYNQTRRQL